MLGRWDARTLTLPSNFELTSTRSTGYSKSGLCTCTTRSAVLSCTHVRQRACAHATCINHIRSLCGNVARSSVGSGPDDTPTETHDMLNAGRLPASRV
jgi:hypothetical protein